MQNPFVKRIHPDLDIWGVFFLTPQRGVYVWTGTGVKPEGMTPRNGTRPFRAKEYRSEQEAMNALSEVKQHIREWKTDCEPYIQE